MARRGVLPLILASAALLAATRAAVADAAASTIAINASVLAAPFDGFFGLSGGGATSRLLAD
jgi:hypothetical protein